MDSGSVSRTGELGDSRLFLPGEHASYGDQDYRSPSERWKLKRNVRYGVRIKRVHPAKPDELVRITALDAPRRITGAPH